MPVINVQMLRGRTAQQKKDFMVEVASVAMRTLQVPSHAVVILITEVEPEDWSVGERSMFEIRSDQSR